MSKNYPKVGVKDVVKSYWKVLKELKGWAILALVGSIGMTLVDLAIPLYYRDFFNQLQSAADKVAAIPYLVHILVIILILNIVEWVFARAGTRGIDRLQTKGSAKLKQSSYEYLIKHSYTFFSNNFTGSLTQKIGRYTRAFERLTDRVIWNFLPLLVRITGTLIVVWTIRPSIAVVILIWSILFLIFNYFFSRFKLKYDLESAEADSKTTAALADSLTNHNTIQLFTGYHRETATFRKVTANQAFLNLRALNWDAIIEAVQSFFVLSMEFALFYVSIDAWAKGELSLGTFVLFQSYILGLGYRLWDFGRIVRDFYQGFADAKEMVEIISLPHEIKDIRGAKTLAITTGNVEFKDVEFHFNENRKVLNKINVSITGGEKIALIGPSGAGKSTFVRLLLRIYDVVSGHILIDDQDIATITQESLHKNVSLVPQDPILFHRTLMENIRYGKPTATDDEVKEAARLAHCDEFIESLPLQYETFVGERGIKLSGGERQRVAIARAILKNAPILVLDEATSSLDSHSEMLIQDALEKLMAGKTTLVIAHRLSTIRKMDRIIVVDDGSILEEGTHESLLAKKGSLYATLWNLQAGGFIKEIGEDATLSKEEDADEDDE